MRRVIKHLLLPLLFAALLLSLEGCVVHEFPKEDTPVGIDLEFKFNTAFLPFKEVDYTQQQKATTSACIMRYIVRAYPMAADGSIAETPLKEFLFTKAQLEDPDLKVSIEIPEGRYLLKCWFDYISATAQNDNFYHTSNFEKITLTEPYTGDTDYKDAFIGEREIICIRGSKETPNPLYTLEMERPLAKFQFVAVDFGEFVNKIMQETLSPEEYQDYLNKKYGGKNPTNNLYNGYTVEISERDLLWNNTSKAPWDPTQTPGFDPEDYKVVFQYTSFVPNTYNLMLKKPVDAFLGYKFNATISPVNSEEARIGMDYILINGTESSVNLQVLLYSPKGELLSTSNPVKVPMVRGKITTIRGKFLTLQIDGGISLDTDFDGEINIVI